jgi:hypothetical protein
VLAVICEAGEDFGGIGGVRAAVPEREGSLDVAGCLRHFCGKYGAASSNTAGRVAQGTEKLPGEAVFAGGLPHHLHETPGNGADDFLGGRKAERRYVARAKSGLVADRVGVPGRLLLDDRADQRGIEGVLGGDGAC